MPKSPEVLNHLGGYTKHPPVNAFCELSRRCYEAFHSQTDARDQSKDSGRQHAVTRMMYIAETTSIVVRLSASWALSMAAMSLVRDRYEQAVRFSWLARQTDQVEWAKYLGSFYAKTGKLYRSLNEAQRAELEKMVGEPEEWLKGTPTREQREYLDRWETLALDAMARKRDGLAPVGATRLDRTTLGDLYNSIYRQFSSVTHYDFYGLAMLRLHHAPTGQWVMAPDPQWPAMLCLHNTLFDLIQCREATKRYFDVDDPEYEKLFTEWNDCLVRMGISEG